MGEGVKMLQTLTEVEREVYELIKQVGEIMAKDIPLKKAGAIPSLVRKGLVEVCKRPATTGSRKRHKFLRLKGETR
jgi:hypothetical protein